MGDAVGAKVMGFCDFSRYVIRDVMQATLFRFQGSAVVIKGQVGLAFVEPPRRPHRRELRRD